MRNKFRAIAVCFAIVAMGFRAEAGPVLDAVKARGELICGVPAESVGFSTVVNGKYVGLAVDVCRAAGAAIFGDATKVKFVPLPPDKRFPSLKSGEVDLLVSNSTVTLTRAAELGFDFLAVYFYDGQGMLVRRKLGKRSIKDLNGMSVCVAGGTTSERNLANYFNANKMTFKPVVLPKVEEVRAAFFGGKCDAYTADAAALYVARAAYAPAPQDYMVLLGLMSKEPLAQVVREGDAAFARIVRWSFLAMIEAEEKRITSKNIDDMLKSEDETIKRLLGVTPGLGKSLGVDDRWVYNVVKQVGNYGESFDRNLGAGSGLKISRGQNALATEGGMHYAPPFQ